MDNQTTQQDNSQTQETQETQTQETQETQQTTSDQFSWKSRLGADLGNSPLLEKFDDSPEGLNEAFKSHSNLEKLLGNEKVPVPKGPDDVEGWARFNKAMGIPDRAEDYGLADANIPESLKSMTFDKKKFAEVAHAYKLTPSQAKGLWETYTNLNMEAMGNYQKTQQAQLTELVNSLRSEWGDAYDSNVELAQLVVSKFAGSKESDDFVTASLMKDPRGLKFLSKLGAQFAENKVGEFQYARYSKTPEEIQGEIHKITMDMSHPYMNEKASTGERKAAIDYVNSLYMQLNKAKQG